MFVFWIFEKKNKIKTSVCFFSFAWSGRVFEHMGFVGLWVVMVGVGILMLTIGCIN